MVITFEFLHSFRNLWDRNILFIICSTRRRVARPTLFICAQSMSSRPADLLFLNVLIPFRRSSIQKGDVSMHYVVSCLYHLHSLANQLSWGCTILRKGQSMVWQRYLSWWQLVYVETWVWLLSHFLKIGALLSDTKDNYVLSTEWS